MSAERESNAILGTWRLERLVVSAADGTESTPYGDAPAGYLLYNADGYMSVDIMTTGRALFDAADITAGTIEERAEAATTYISYCGTYELRSDSVVHHIELSLFPNWIGKDQVRFFALDGDSLVLRTPPMLIEGSEQTVLLRWRRVRR